MTHEDWMRLAIAQAEKAAVEGEVPVGAVLVLEEECIAVAHNQPIQNSDPTAHAEVQVLRGAAKQLKNYRLPESTLYVTLEPCLMCLGAMVHARIKTCVFGAFDPKSGAVTTKILGFDLPVHNHSVKAVGGVLADECGGLLQDFFRSRR